MKKNVFIIIIALLFLGGVTYLLTTKTTIEAFTINSRTFNAYNRNIYEELFTKYESEKYIESILNEVDAKDSEKVRVALLKVKEDIIDKGKYCSTTSGFSAKNILFLSYEYLSQDEFVVVLKDIICSPYVDYRNKYVFLNAVATNPEFFSDDALTYIYYYGKELEKIEPLVEEPNVYNGNYYSQMMLISSYLGYEEEVEIYAQKSEALSIASTKYVKIEKNKLQGLYINIRQFITGKQCYYVHNATDLNYYRYEEVTNNEVLELNEMIRFSGENIEKRLEAINLLWEKSVIQEKLEINQGFQESIRLIVKTYYDYRSNEQFLGLIETIMSDERFAPNIKSEMLYALSYLLCATDNEDTDTANKVIKIIEDNYEMDVNNAERIDLAVLGTLERVSEKVDNEEKTEKYVEMYNQCINNYYSTEAEIYIPEDLCELFED